MPTFRDMITIVIAMMGIEAMWLILKENWWGFPLGILFVILVVIDRKLEE